MSYKWISVKERLPEPGKHLWLHRASEPRGLGWNIVIISALHDVVGYFQRNSDVTHWMPAEIPAPPKSESEQAFDDWAKVHPIPTEWAHFMSNDLAKTIFLAGFEAGRSAK